MMEAIQDAVQEQPEKPKTKVSFKYIISMKPESAISVAWQLLCSNLTELPHCVSEISMLLSYQLDG